jgi:hypothetical protein
LLAAAAVQKDAAQDEEDESSRAADGSADSGANVGVAVRLFLLLFLCGRSLCRAGIGACLGGGRLCGEEKLAPKISLLPRSPLNSPTLVVVASDTSRYTVWATHAARHAKFVTTGPPKGDVWKMVKVAQSEPSGHVATLPLSNVMSELKQAVGMVHDAMDSASGSAPSSSSWHRAA